MSGVSLGNWIEAICGPGALADVGPALLPALVLAGLVGGAVHCAGMRGPFVLAQATSRSSQRAGSVLSRLVASSGWCEGPGAFWVPTDEGVAALAGANNANASLLP